MRHQMRAFDTYTHINELKETGFNEKQAAVIIKSLVESRETDISHLATREQVLEVKSQLIEQITKIDTKISEMHTSTLKWVIGTMIALSSVMLAGIKLL